MWHVTFLYLKILGSFEFTKYILMFNSKRKVVTLINY